MTVICDAPLIWWPMSGMRGMDLKRVYFRNYSQRYMHFASCWLSEMVWSCVNTWCDVTGKCWNFKANFIIQSQQKKPTWQYQRRSMKTISYHHHPATHVRTCVIYLYLFIVTAANQVPRRDWYISAVSKLKFFNTNLKIFSYGVWRTSRALTKWNMNAPKSKSECVFNIYSWYKLRLVNFHGTLTLNI